MKKCAGGIQNLRRMLVGHKSEKCKVYNRVQVEETSERETAKKPRIYDEMNEDLFYILHFFLRCSKVLQLVIKHAKKWSSIYLLDWNVLQSKSFISTHCV